MGVMNSRVSTIEDGRGMESFVDVVSVALLLLCALAIQNSSYSAMICGKS